MRPLAQTAAALLATLSTHAAALADGELETLAFKSLNPTQTSQLVAGGLRVTATRDFGFPGIVNVAATGLGVVGAASDATLDPSEALRFDFDGFLAEHAWFTPGTVINADADALVGEYTLTGYGPLGANLGSVAIVSSRTLYLNEHFGGSPLSGFRITPQGDRFFVDAVSWIRAPALTCADFESLGTFSTTTLNTAGIRITATEDFGFPGTVRVTAANGLGVVGAVSSTTVDTSEALRFDFQDALATDIWIIFGLQINGDADAHIGEARLTPLGPGGALLGPAINLPEAGALHINALVAGTPLSGFIIEPIDEDRFIISHLCYIAPAAGCGSDINHDGNTDVIDFAEFLLDFGCTADD